MQLEFNFVFKFYAHEHESRHQHFCSFTGKDSEADCSFETKNEALQVIWILRTLF